MPAPWNGNLHYDTLVLSVVPPGCRRALDVGCGDGRFTRLLAEHSADTLGIDVDAAILQTTQGKQDRLAFVVGDVMTQPLPEADFDFISLIATLHHLPLVPALRRVSALLRPGGVLAVVGLYRSSGWQDHAWDAAGFAATHLMRCVRPFAHQQAPMQPPRETLRDLRLAADTWLPGATLRRRLFFRYSLVWRKP